MSYNTNLKGVENLNNSLTNSENHAEEDRKSSKKSRNMLLLFDESFTLGHRNYLYFYRKKTWFNHAFASAQYGSSGYEAREKDLQ
ncbi:hypothetical protein GCM10023310_11690 [Paenibacillus vulneris]